MASQAELNLIKKSKMIAMIKCGKNKKDIMEEVGCSIKTIEKWRKSYKLSGEDGLIDQQVNNKGPRMTTTLEDQRLFEIAEQNPFDSTAKIIEDANSSISVRTGQRRLNENELENEQPAKKADLDYNHRQLRLQYARDHIRWTQDQWNMVIWSDEKVLFLNKIWQIFF